MPEMSKHVASTRRENGLPGGVVFRWFCSCGRVGQSVSGDALRVQQAGDAHAKAGNRALGRRAEAAEVIRRAARLMRERALAALPGPWMFDDGANCWCLHSAPEPNMPTMQILKAPKRHNCPQYEEYWPDAATGAHIVSWSPVPALAVAEWLDESAEGVGFLQAGALRVATAFLREGGDGR